MADNSFLDKNDTVNSDANQDFNLFFDLAVKGELNKFINFYSELRLGNSLEVFDTSSSYLNLRRILIYGDLNKNMSFEIGDIDLKMTPFTLWNFQEEGIVNENRLANNFREIQRYENFNNGNFWRRQGLVINGFKPIFKSDSIKYKTFGTRELHLTRFQHLMSSFMEQKLNISPIYFHLVSITLIYFLIIKELTMTPT